MTGSNSESEHVNIISGDLKIIFWNARSILPKKEELPSVMGDCDVFVCVESWLTKKVDYFRISGYKTFRRDREDFRQGGEDSRGGGILFLVKNNLSFQIISDLTCPDVSVEVAGVRLGDISPPLDLICVYRTPGSTLSQGQWDGLVGNVSNRVNTLVLGDFNAHHLFWNCGHTDVNGERLLQSVESSDLFLHNFDTLTHHDFSTGSESNIDLAFSSQSMAGLIEVSVLDELFGSDHYPLIAQFSFSRNLYRKKTLNKKTKKTNWEGFSRDLDSQYDSFFSRDYVESSVLRRYMIFMTLVTSALVSNTPETKIVADKIHRNPVPWWDSDCERSKRLKRAAFKKYRLSGSIDDLIEYKRQLASARRVFKSKRRASFRKFAGSLSIKSGLKHVWDTCKILKNKWVRVARTPLPNSQVREQIALALDKFCPPFVSPDPCWVPPLVKNSFLDSGFGFSDFNIALEGKDEGSACGLDGIDYSVLRRLPLRFKLILVDIFNEMYTSGQYPQDWKKSFVHFIGKPDGSGVRPISLISCTCKIFETMVKNRLQWWLEFNDMFPANQAGFRKGRSTADSLTGLTLSVEESFSRGKGTFAAFLDINSAFPSVNPSILIDRLVTMGISTNIINYVNASTFERQIFCDFLGSDFRYSYQGLPQGGVLSPLLYNLYVAQICKGVPKSVTVSMFADDIAVYCSRGSRESCERLVGKAIDVIYTNLWKLGLELSPRKTVLVYFNRRGVRPCDVSLTIRDTVVNGSEVARFLGILFDYRLNFDIHVKQVHSKCTRALNLIKFVRGVWWGADPGTLLLLYKSFVRSILDYGIFVYLPTRKKTLERLEGIQYSAIRLALGFRVSTPKNLLLGEAKLTRIVDRARFLGSKYLDKVSSNTGHVMTRYIDTFRKKMALRRNRNKFQSRVFFSCIRETGSSIGCIHRSPRYGIYNVPYEALTNSISVDLDLGRELQASADPSARFLDFLRHRECTVWYTDGSRSDVDGSVRVGCASFSPVDNINISRCLDGRASIFTAESVALLDAVEMAARSPAGDVLIVSDSLSALMALRSTRWGVDANPYILETRRKCFLFERDNCGQFRIGFVWVPGHVGISGNETVDKLAKAASLVAVDNSVALPYSDLARSAGDRAWADTVDHIKEVGLTKGVEYVNTYMDSRRRPWFLGMDIPRHVIVTINRCRVNHHSLASSLFKIKVVESPDCPCGGGIQDLNHVLWQCSLHDEHRRRLTGDLVKLQMLPPYTASMILYKPNVRLLRIVSRFFEKCKLAV